MQSVPNRLGRRWLLTACCLLLCWRAFAEVVHVMPAATVHGAVIRFRDVVAHADTLPEGWGKRVVGHAPGDGEARMLALGAIAAALHVHDDMQDVELRGQPEIRLTIRSQSVDADMLDRVLAEHMETLSEHSGRRLRVSRENMPEVQGGESVTNAVLMRIRTDKDDGGLDALFHLEGPEYLAPAEGFVAFPLTELRAYWAVARPLMRGAVLKQDDIKETWVPVEDGARCYPVTDPIVGMEVRRNLQSGQIPHMGMLAAPVFAKRGEILRVRFRQGGLTVTLRARALSDGRREERIACVNERSGRRMYVRLVDVREAVLDSEQRGG